jgi:hypothetical protein
VNRILVHGEGLSFGPSPALFGKAKMIRIALLTLALIQLNCEEPGAGPPPEEKPFPHNLKWTRDTLGRGFDQSGLFGIWGSAANDVYVVGYGSAPFAGKIHHWDGSSWTDLSPKYAEAFLGNPIYGWTPTRVFGLSAQDVWIVGSKDSSAEAPGRGFIMHKSGGLWSGLWPSDSQPFLSIWGSSASDIWVGGVDKWMRHYNGSTWTKHSLPDSVAIQHIYGVTSTDVYATGWITWNGPAADIRYYHWNGTSWTLIEQGLENDPSRMFNMTSCVWNGDVYSSAGQQVTRRLGVGSWSVVRTMSGASDVFVQSVGSSGILAVGSGPDREVAEYFDGVSWTSVTVPTVSNASVGRIWSDGTHLFIAELERTASATPWPRTYVLRGTP